MTAASNSTTTLSNDPSDRSHSPEKCVVRGLRWRRRTFGNHRVIDRDLQDQRRRSAGLPHRRHYQDRERPPQQRYRSAVALGLPKAGTQSRGLRTTVTDHPYLVRLETTAV